MECTRNRGAQQTICFLQYLEHQMQYTEDVKQHNSKITRALVKSVQQTWSVCLQACSCPLTFSPGLCPLPPYWTLPPPNIYISALFYLTPLKNTTDTIPNFNIKVYAVIITHTEPIPSLCTHNSQYMGKLFLPRKQSHALPDNPVDLWSRSQYNFQKYSQYIAVGKCAMQDDYYDDSEQ